MTKMRPPKIHEKPVPVLPDEDVRRLLELVLPIGTKAPRDIDRYIRIRAGHPRAADTWLWLGTKGRLTASGVYQMIKYREAAAVLPDTGGCDRIEGRRRASCGS